MHWSKSRLSHHLTRMQERGLVMRQAVENEAGVCITITPIGREVLNRARPIHTQAVRHQLLDRLTPEELRLLAAVSTRLESEQP